MEKMPRMERAKDLVDGLERSQQQPEPWNLKSPNSVRTHDPTYKPHVELPLYVTGG